MNQIKNPVFAAATRRRISSFVTAALIITSFLCVSVARAAQPEGDCYTLASIQGSYGMVGYYTGGIALAIAVESFDGNGNLTRKAIVNGPPAVAGAPRKITPTTSTGTLTVNCDGTGTITRMLTNVTTGVVSGPFTHNFVITGAVVKGGPVYNSAGTLVGSQLIATTFTDAQVEVSAIVPGGVFVYYVHTRVPDRAAPPQ